MKALFSIIFLVLNFTCCAQNHYVYKGSQRYRATSPWDFKVENFPEGLTVQIAKTAQGGLCMLSAHTGFRGTIITGTLVIYLEDGSVIKCLDRKVKDMTNGNSRAIYYLTSNEIQMLTSSRINQLRFAIGSVNGFSTLDGAYMAKNDSSDENMISVPTGGFINGVWQEGISQIDSTTHTEEEVAALVE